MLRQTLAHATTSSPSLISSTDSTKEPVDDAVEYCQCLESDDEAQCKHERDA